MTQHVPSHSHFATESLTEQVPDPAKRHKHDVSHLLPEKLGIWPCDSGACSTGMMALKDWSYLLPPQLSPVPAGSGKL